MSAYTPHSLQTSNHGVSWGTSGYVGYNHSKLFFFTEYSYRQHISPIFFVISKKLSNFALVNGALAHLARAFDWQSKGGRFESCMLHKKKSPSLYDRGSLVAFLLSVI